MIETLSYSRTITIQACHFNGEQTYRALDEADSLQDEHGHLKLLRALDLWKEIASDCHGHNFKITVYAEGPIPKSGEASFLIADEELTEMIMKWEGCNLSLLPEFREIKARATTEWMARLLIPKVLALCKAEVDLVRVTVAENELICSTVEHRKKGDKK